MFKAIAVLTRKFFEVFRLGWRQSNEHAVIEAAGDETKEEWKARRPLVSGSHSTQFASRLIFELFIYKLQHTAKQHAAI